MNEEIQLLLRPAIAAAKAGHKDQARALLEQVVAADPDNETAWLWMSGMVDDDRQRRACLEQVLRVNPENPYARAGLAKLGKTASLTAPIPSAQPVQSQVQNLPGKPWYFSDVMLLLAFLFCFPLWIVLILADKRQRKTSKVVAGIIGIGCLLLCSGWVLSNLLRISPSRGSQSIRATPTKTMISPQLSGPQLALLSMQDELSPGGGYFVIEGEVKNISNTSLENVTAVVSVYDSDHKFITSDSALIEYTTLLPAQTSPFEVMVDYNPAIVSYKVEFKHLLGGTISTRDDR
jgi:hypothetical protein